jgi:Ulp1 family protease
MRSGDENRLVDEYLNDNIIDFRIKWYLIEDSPAEVVAQLHIFSCQFYSRFTSERNSTEGYRLVMTWTRHLELLRRRHIFIPVNMSAHWSLSIVVRPDLILHPVATTCIHIIHYLRNRTDSLQIAGETNKSCFLFMDSLSLHGGKSIYKKVLQ